jgi:hypothetical protein
MTGQAVRTDDWEAAADRSRKARERRMPVLACGGGTQQMDMHDDAGIHCDH